MIRAGGLADASAVAELINAINMLGDDVPDPPMTAAIVLRDLICEKPRALLRVAELKGEVVGFVTAGFISMRCARPMR